MAEKYRNILPWLLLLSLPALAQEWPDEPKPKLIERVDRAPESAPHPFFDRQNTIAISTSFAVRAADAIQTCRLMRKRLIVTAPIQPNYYSGTFVYPYFHEGGAPVDTCAGIVAFNAGIAVLGAGTSALFHKMGHHKLERWPNWISAEPSAYGIIRNLNYHAEFDPRNFPPGTTYKVQ